VPIAARIILSIIPAIIARLSAGAVRRMRGRHVGLTGRDSKRLSLPIPLSLPCLLSTVAAPKALEELAALPPKTGYPHPLTSGSARHVAGSGQAGKSIWALNGAF